MPISLRDKIFQGFSAAVASLQGGRTAAPAVADPGDDYAYGDASVYARPDLVKFVSDITPATGSVTAADKPQPPRL